MDRDDFGLGGALEILSRRPQARRASSQEPPKKVAQGPKPGRSPKARRTPNPRPGAGAPQGLRGAYSGTGLCPKAVPDYAFGHLVPHLYSGTGLSYSGTGLWFHSKKHEEFIAVPDYA